MYSKIMNFLIYTKNNKIIVLFEDYIKYEQIKESSYFSNLLKKQGGNIIIGLSMMIIAPIINEIFKTLFFKRELQKKLEREKREEYQKRILNQMSENDIKKDILATKLKKQLLRDHEAFRKSLKTVPKSERKEKMDEFIESKRKIYNLIKKLEYKYNTSVLDEDLEKIFNV